MKSIESIDKTAKSIVAFDSINYTGPIKSWRLCVPNLIDIKAMFGKL